MKPALSSKQQIPYGGNFRIMDRQNSVVVSAKTFEALLPKMRKQRESNGVPMGIGFEDEVEKWCCEDYPDECENMDPDAPKRRNLGLADIVNGTKVMVAFKLAGSPLVSQAEAERRAAICATCPFNLQFHKPCSGVCPELQDLVLAIVGPRGTTRDNDLNACNVCGCFLKAAVFLPLEIQCKGVGEQMRKQFANVPWCWKQCS